MAATLVRGRHFAEELLGIFGVKTTYCTKVVLTAAAKDVVTLDVTTLVESEDLDRFEEVVKRYKLVDPEENSE